MGQVSAWCPLPSSWCRQVRFLFLCWQRVLLVAEAMGVCVLCPQVHHVSSVLEVACGAIRADEDEEGHGQIGKSMVSQW